MSTQFSFLRKDTAFLSLMHIMERDRVLLFRTEAEKALFLLKSESSPNVLLKVPGAPDMENSIRIYSELGLSYFFCCLMEVLCERNINFVLFGPSGEEVAGLPRF